MSSDTDQPSAATCEDGAALPEHLEPKILACEIPPSSKISSRVRGWAAAVGAGIEASGGDNIY